MYIKYLIRIFFSKLVIVSATKTVFQHKIQLLNELNEYTSQENINYTILLCIMVYR